MRLYGRHAENRRIDSLLDSARAGRSGVLVLRGEPGIGKTTILDATSGRASGLTVLHARGLEVEAHLAFSGLSDLVTPVLRFLEAIPAQQSAALAGALAVGPACPADRFVVCAATLSLLAAAAEEQPVLVIIDDVQWIDDPSRDALLFAARRLEAEQVAIIMAVLDTDRPLDAPGVDEVVLEGLDSSSARDLLQDQLGRPIAPRVLNRLMDLTAGNPLALRELCISLSEAQLDGAEELGERLPAVLSVERAFLRRVQRLPAETRAALVVAAADSGDTSRIQKACALLGLPSNCLDPAEELGVIRGDGTTTSFAHPLVRAAVYNSASSFSREQAHQALADVLERAESEVDRSSLGPSPLERRAWQLGAATRQPNEAVASTLHAAASEARSRSGYAAAAAAGERAARLTPKLEERATRLAESARDWHVAGRPEAAAGLLDEALQLAHGANARAAIQLERARIKMWRGRFSEASELLAFEAAAIAEEDPESAALMLLDAATAASTCGAVRTSVELARKAWTLAEPLGGYVADASRAVLGGALELHGEPVSDDERRWVVEAVVSIASLRPPPPIAVIAPVILTELEEYERADLVLDRFHDDARKMSAPAFLVPVLCLRADVAFRTGNWIRAYADAAESLRLARETGQLAFHSLAFLARVEAARGLDTDCRAHAQEALQLADPDRIGATTTYARWSLGLLALGRGWIPEAIDHLERVAELVEEHEMRQPIEVPWAQDLVEAYARIGRRADAARVLDRFQDQAEASRLSSALAAASRCRGLLADQDGFRVEFGNALRFHERTPTPFERARTELCFGETLRRARHRSDARDHLRAALDTFERLDAVPWSARARAELAATGEISNPSREQWTRMLTPQEVQLSIIVGRGATNKEASAALFISPKTVEAHLHRVYLKLGIRSRTELAGLVARAHVGE